MIRLRLGVLFPCGLFVIGACSASSSSPEAGGPGDATPSQAAGQDAAAPYDGSDESSPLAACPPGPGVGDFPLDVAAVLKAKCQTCHTNPPRNHAPFELLDYEDTRKADPVPPYVGQPIWQVMHIVIQTDGVPHMPLSTAPQLTPAEFQTLDGWLSACAMPVPEGSGGDADDDAGPRAGAGESDAAND